MLSNIQSSSSLKFNSNQLKSQNITSSQILTDSYRYVNLFLFMLVAICNALPCQTFAGVSPSISQIYNVSLLEISLGSLCYSILYLFMILPSNYIIDHKGLKYGTLICQSCMVIGLIVRCFINVNYHFFTIGTFICGFGFCFTISAAHKFPNVWFQQKQIFIIKSFLIFLLFTSDGVGFFVPTLLIDQSSSQQDVQTFLWIESSIVIAFNLLNMVFFRNLPVSPQNHSSQIQRNEDYKTNLRCLFSNKNYVKLFFGMTFAHSNTNLIFVAIAWFGQAYGVSQKQCGYILIVTIFSGIIGCLINGLVLKNKYRLKCKTHLIISTLAFVIITVAFQMNEYWLILLSGILIGMTTFPFLVTVCDYAAQAAFPVGQGTSGGSIFFGGNTFGALSIILFSIYVDKDVNKQKCRLTAGLIIAFILLSLLFIYLSKQQLKRTQYQTKTSQSYRSSSTIQSSNLKESLISQNGEE